MDGLGKFNNCLEAAPEAMVVVTAEGIISQANNQAQKLFGFLREEMNGQKIEMLIPERIRKNHIQNREFYIRTPSPFKIGESGQRKMLFGMRRDGTEFPIEVSLSPLATGKGQLIIAAIRDVTAQKETERQLKVSINEKEILLKELHHRVKNNLQLILSLFNLENEIIKGSAAYNHLRDIRTRIQSIALIHTRLCRSEDLSQIKFADYIKELIEALFESFAVNSEQITCILDIDDIGLDMDSVISCGLIVNELVSNSLKHAFSRGEKGLINVALKRNESGKVSLSVSDNGCGMTDGSDVPKDSKLGLKLVRGLAKELGISLEVLPGRMKSSEGTKYYD